MEIKYNGLQIAKIIQTYQNTQYETNAAYYLGSNPTITNKDFNGTPDNRVPLPFARRTVLDVLGYAYKPGYVNYVFDVIDDNNEQEVEKIEEIFEENIENMVSAEIFQDTLVKGEGAELIYFDGSKTKNGYMLPKFVKIPREQVIFLYEDDIEEKLKCSIRFYTSTIINDMGEAQKVKHADVYYKDIIQFFELKDYSIENTVDPQLDTQVNTVNKANTFQLVYEEKHFFGDIPLYPYRINSDRMGVFQPAIPIIDAMDDMTSDSILNALGRFNDHYLTLSKKLDAVSVQDIKEKKIFDDLGTDGDFVQFINRQMDINSTVEGFKTYERLYYELTGIPQLSDEKFHAQSGIAILYALIPFENLVSTMQVYFDKGLKYRLKLINNLLKTAVKAKIEWKRNIPDDTSAKINEIMMLKREGLISTETALSRLPMELIDDVELEMEKIKTEKEENMALFESNFTEPMADGNQEGPQDKEGDKQKNPVEDKEDNGDKAGSK